MWWNKKFWINAIWERSNMTMKKHVKWKKLWGWIKQHNETVERHKKLAVVVFMPTVTGSSLRLYREREREMKTNNRKQPLLLKCASLPLYKMLLGGVWLYCYQITEVLVMREAPSTYLHRYQSNRYRSAKASLANSSRRRRPTRCRKSHLIVG